SGGLLTPEAGNGRPLHEPAHLRGALSGGRAALPRREKQGSRTSTFGASTGSTPNAVSRTRTARELAVKAVVLVDPERLRGTVVWPFRRSPGAACIRNRSPEAAMQLSG